MKMANITILLNCIKSERIKAGSSFIYPLTLLSPLLPVIFQFGIYHNKPEFFIPEAGVNPWIKFISSNYTLMMMLLFPFFQVMLTSMLTNMERKSEGWKHLFVAGIPKEYLYFSKLFFQLLLTILFLTSCAALTIISGYLLGSLHPELNLLNFPPVITHLLTLLSKAIIIGLAISSIQLLLSLIFKNHMIPMAFGIAGGVSSIILANLWSKSIYIPYAYPTLYNLILKKRLNITYFSLFNEIDIYALCYFLVFTILGCLYFRKARMV